MIKIITMKTDDISKTEDFEKSVNNKVDFYKRSGYQVNKIEISHSACVHGNYGTSIVLMCVIDYDDISVG